MTKSAQYGPQFAAEQFHARIAPNNAMTLSRIVWLWRPTLSRIVWLCAPTSPAQPPAQAKAAEPSLLAGLLVDAKGERLTPSHAVKKGRRYRYYISAALITDAGTDRAQGWRLAAREIEAEDVTAILSDALTSPARLVERFGAAEIPSDQMRKILGRAAHVERALAVAHPTRARAQSP